MQCLRVLPKYEGNHSYYSGSTLSMLVLLDRVSGFFSLFREMNRSIAVVPIPLSLVPDILAIIILVLLTSFLC